MSTTPRERNDPTTEELLELLDMLKDAAKEGQLRTLAFMLHQPISGATIVDYRGTFELAELTSRTVNNRIADSIQLEYPSIAAAIRRDLVNLDLSKIKH